MVTQLQTNAAVVQGSLMKMFTMSPAPEQGYSTRSRQSPLSPLPGHTHRLLPIHKNKSPDFYDHQLVLPNLERRLQEALG